MTIQLHDTLSDDVRPFAPLDIGIGLAFIDRLGRTPEQTTLRPVLALG